MLRKSIGTLLLGAAALALAACGGGGGGGGSRLVSTPPPPPAPPAPPPPAGPFAVAPFGVNSTTEFAAVGADLKIGWNAELNAYEITVPGHPTAKVVPRGERGYEGGLVAADGTSLPLKAFMRPTGPAWQPFSYTSWVQVGAKGIGDPPTAFGIATPSDSVPTTGSAVYKAEIAGVARATHGTDLYQFSVYGGAQFEFDFGSGKLSGYMEPHLNGGWDAPAPLARYTFTNTVYSAGSPTFSGSFDIAGPGASSFQGRFTGPLAQELMAGWTAPFMSWDNQWGMMEGVMIGKRE